MMVEVFLRIKDAVFDPAQTLIEAHKLLTPLGFTVDSNYPPVPMSNSYIVRATGSPEAVTKASTQYNPRIMVWSDPKIS